MCVCECVVRARASVCVCSRARARRRVCLCVCVCARARPRVQITPHALISKVTSALVFRLGPFSITQKPTSSLSAPAPLFPPFCLLAVAVPVYCREALAPAVHHLMVTATQTGRIACPLPFFCPRALLNSMPRAAICRLLLEDSA